MAPGSLGVVIVTLVIVTGVPSQGWAQKNLQVTNWNLVANNNLPAATGAQALPDSTLFCICKQSSSDPNASYKCNCSNTLAGIMTAGGNQPLSMAGDAGAKPSNPENAGILREGPSQAGSKEKGPETQKGGAVPGSAGGNIPIPVVPTVGMPPMQPSGNIPVLDMWTWVICAKMPLGTGKPIWDWLRDFRGYSVKVNGKWLTHKCSYGGINPFYINTATYVDLLNNCKARGFDVVQPADFMNSYWYPFQLENTLTEHFRQKAFMIFEHMPQVPLQMC